MADGAQGSADQGKRFGDLPRIAHVERDGADGAGDVDRDQSLAPLGRHLREGLQQIAILAIDTGLLGDAEQGIGARIAFGMGAVADARHALFPFAVVVDDRSGDGVEIGILGVGRKRLGQHFRRPFRRAEMNAAGAAQRGGNCGLHRFGSAVVDKTRRDHVRDHAVLNENNQQGVEHLCLIRRRQPAAQDQRSHIRKSNFTDQFFIQIITAHEYSMQLRFTDARDDFCLFRHV